MYDDEGLEGVKSRDRRKLVGVNPEHDFPLSRSLRLKASRAQGQCHVETNRAYAPTDEGPPRRGSHEGRVGRVGVEE